MEDSFYTSVYQRGSKIYLKGYNGNTRIKEVVTYKPYLFRPKVGGFYRTINGIEVDKVYFDSMKEADVFLEEFREVDNVTIYGINLWPYLFIYDNYPGKIQYNTDRIKVVSIDIECAADQGFPNVRKADKEITAIALRTKGKTIAFGCGEFVTEDPAITYVRCDNEFDLLTKFLKVWAILDADVVTGWNIEFFDIPYLANRIDRVLGEKMHEKLSPWGIVKERKVEVFNKEAQTYFIAGISTLDYYALYRKFTFSNSESYKLNYIAQVELGDKKIDYSEYGSLLNLYRENFQLFMEYNIHDAVLVERLEAKLNFIKQVMAIAYDAKVNYNDTLTTVRPWDIIIHNYLLDRRIVVPQLQHGRKDRANIGGFVKEPKPGWKRGVASFDLKSSYPHNIMQYNISPETMAGKARMASIDTLITRRRNLQLDYDIPPQYSIAANGCYFRKDKQGFLAALMEEMYEDRNNAVKQHAEVEKEYEKTKDPTLLATMSRLHNYQQAKKIQLNSAYGALANEYFRWFDIDLAEAITSSGQLAVRWVAVSVNEYLNKFFKTTDEDYIIASDTDSIYINLEPLLVLAKVDEPLKSTALIDKFCKEKLQPLIAKSFNDLFNYMNAYKQCMEMTREYIADKAIWTGKKRYILNVYDKKGVTYSQPKLKITGIESVRSSTPQVCREKINEAIKIIMNKGELDLQEFIANFKEEFMVMPFEEVAFPRGINGLLEYGDDKLLYIKGTPIQVKGALIFNHLLRRYDIDTIAPVQDGDKIRFAYLIEPNPIQQSVIAAPDFLPKEFNLDRFIDREKQFDKAFVEPLRTITSCISWNVEPVATLLDWFA